MKISLSVEFVRRMQTLGKAFARQSLSKFRRSFFQDLCAAVYLQTNRFVGSLLERRPDFRSGTVTYFSFLYHQHSSCASVRIDSSDRFDREFRIRRKALKCPARASLDWFASSPSRWEVVESSSGCFARDFRAKCRLEQAERSSGVQIKLNGAAAGELLGAANPEAEGNRRRNSSVAMHSDLVVCVPGWNGDYRATDGGGG